MGPKTLLALWFIGLVVVVVGIDVLFFRNLFWERLIANVAIVLLFIAFYFKFFR